MVFSRPRSILLPLTCRSKCGGQQGGYVSIRNPPERVGDCVVSSLNSVHSNLLPLSMTANAIAAISDTPSVTGGNVGVRGCRPPQYAGGSRYVGPNYNNSSWP